MMSDMQRPKPNPLAIQSGDYFATQGKDHWPDNQTICVMLKQMIDAKIEKVRIKGKHEGWKMAMSEAALMARDRLHPELADAFEALADNMPEEQQ